MALQLSVSKLPWYGQVGAFVGVSGLALGGFYYFYAIPAQEAIAQQQKRADALRGDIRKAQAIARQLPAFQAQVLDLQTRLESLKAVLPEQKDVADLLRRIQTLATQSNLTIKGFKPQAIKTQQLHAEWPIVLELDGTYHNLGRFFDKISKFSRIINVSDLNIKGKEKPDENSTITAQCMATTFVLLETPAPAAAATSGASPPGSARASR
ncbi:MAG: type 4a pilus biogenesis protein PilO [Acidobacteria bacterium]|nr:type 4a pilus biogenesis protein PilO [Acidobacteriota bacterium]